LYLISAGASSLYVLLPRMKLPDGAEIVKEKGV
jgi:hypothetical protein